MTAVGSRDELLRTLAAEPIDCIILDYNLGTDTAATIARELKVQRPDVPLLVVSPANEQSVVIESMRSGVVDFLPKTLALAPGELLNRVSVVVADSRRLVADRRAAARRMRRLTKQCHTDPLTGLCNRRGLLSLLRSARTRHDRREHTAVVMFDLDHFKSINDTWGHPLGDQVLRQAAERMRHHAQPSAMLARWGGEEFLAMLPSATLTEAWLWADRVRESLADIKGPWLDDSRRISASVGVDVLPTSEFEESSLLRADRALYLAKELGRNRVCTWPMVVAFEAAEELQMERGWNTRTRLRALVGRLRATFGLTQFDHTGPHGEQVRIIAAALGLKMGLSREEMERLEIAAEFHDIGKACIPEELLAAPRPLTAPERKVMDLHAQVGAAIIRACGISDDIADIVELHHARFDDPGSMNTPGPAAARHRMLASILALADSVSAMISDRPYARRRTYGEAMREVQFERGRKFEPHAADLMTQDWQLAAA